MSVGRSGAVWLVSLVVAAAICAVTVNSASAMTDSALVGTQYGELQGQVTSGDRIFQGIPFAAPPVGSLRWRSPQPPASWSGVRGALQPGPRCAQNVVLPLNTVGSTSEDCLYLNVYTPATGAANLPVIVWFHGGAWIIGAGSDYDPADLSSRNNVIVVTVNYRLGAFGWLALPGLASENSYHSTGDYGLQDQQAALRWVKANIAGFGGDPDNVTIAGESAGAFNVCDHLAAPGSAGLFEKAIMESGPCSSVIAAITSADMQARSTRFAARAGLGCTGTPAAVVTCMRSKSTEQLLAAQAPSDASGDPILVETPFLPSVDGHYLTMTPRQAILTGHAHRVPVLIGTNRNEGNLFVSTDSSLDAVNADNYRSTLANLLGNFAPVGGRIGAAILAALYPLRNYSTPPGYDPFVAPAHLATGAILTDALFSCSAQNTDRFASGAGWPIYAYEFNDPSPPGALSNPAFPMGSFHSSELQYVFGNPAPAGSDVAFAGMTPPQVTLSLRMQAYWTNFARTGNPNGPGLPTWPAYAPLGGKIMNLAPSDNTIGPISTTAFGLEHKCAINGPLDLILPDASSFVDLLPTSRAGT